MGRKDNEKLASEIVTLFENLLSMRSVAIPDEDRDEDDNAAISATDRQELEDEIISLLEDKFSDEDNDEYIEDDIEELDFERNVY